MQTDIDLTAIVMATLTSLFSSSVTYGVIKTKIARLEKDMEDHQRADSETHSRLVSKDLFDAVLVQVKDDLVELKDNMKELLALIHNKSN